jgi:hypothetical protein
MRCARVDEPAIISAADSVAADSTTKACDLSDDLSGSSQQSLYTSFSPPMQSNGGAAAPSSPNKRIQSSGMLDSSPKRITMVRNTVSVTASEWYHRCPDPSPKGTGGVGSSFLVVIEHFPAAIVTTIKDQRKVAKRTIVVGDDSGKTIDLTIWGNFAARSWTYPEGTILLIKNLKFSGYYKDQIQLVFADADPAHELLITKADESLDVTKRLKKWSVSEFI